MSNERDDTKYDASVPPPDDGGDENDYGRWDEDDNSPPAPPYNPVYREKTSSSREDATETERRVERPKNSCVIMGPSQAGKTMLLAAMQRACHQPGLDDYNLRFVAEGNTGSALAKIAVEIIKQRQSHQPRATGDETPKEEAEYPFWLYATVPPSGLRPGPTTRSVHMVVNDGPGGALFPAENMALSDPIEKWQARLVEDGQEAGSLILCVDATRPRADILESYLPDVIAKMSVDDKQQERVPLRHRALGWIMRQPLEAFTEYDGRWLKADKFLLLLTKVDLICQNIDRVDPSLTPEQVAYVLNPIEQARSLLGVHLLNTIHDALKKDAKFAIGITSAWGFSPISKEPFAGPDGKPGAAPGETGEDILPDWTPFGIRDAMYFIATGEAKGSVRLVRPQDLGVRSADAAQPHRLHNIVAGKNSQKESVL
jgi:hypothetical protein